MKKWLGRHALCFAVAWLFLTFVTVSGVGCPIRAIFGIPCPACGGTRAMLALLRLDFRAYLDYHALAVPLGASALLMIHAECFRKKKAITAVCVTVLALNFLYYVYRLDVLKTIV